MERGKSKFTCTVSVYCLSCESIGSAVNKESQEIAFTTLVDKGWVCLAHGSNWICKRCMRVHTIVSQALIDNTGGEIDEGWDMGLGENNIE